MTTAGRMGNRAWWLVEISRGGQQATPIGSLHRESFAMRLRRMGHRSFRGWEASRVRQPAIVEASAGCFPAAKGVFVDFHVDALAPKLYALDAEAKALFGCGFAS
jgi:hypothetical protein